VELKPGATATPEELLAFARENIAEQAAVPKQIRIIEHMPLTAVGKIAKLPLTFEQVADVVNGELEQIQEIAQKSVEVISDRRLGLLAIVKVTAMPGADKKALEQRIRQALGQYHFRVDLQMAG
jgi:acyl-CoA synthetase (AMP-forming)/AMP-acid ligase II